MWRDQRSPSVRKIAVVRANGIGDYVFSIPALAALRRTYPDAEIVLLGKPWHAAFLAGRPGPIDRVAVVPDYPGVGAEHAHLADIGRARYEQVTDAEVLDAFQLLSRTEGIIPALEPAHALAWVSRARAELAGRTVLLNLSGRGDKDVAQVARILGEDV